MGQLWTFDCLTLIFIIGRILPAGMGIYSWFEWFEWWIYIYIYTWGSDQNLDDMRIFYLLYLLLKLLPYAVELLMPTPHTPCPWDLSVSETSALEIGRGIMKSCKINKSWYCWWKKSCTSRYRDSTIIHMVLSISGGAGFLPSIVWRK